MALGAFHRNKDSGSDSEPESGSQQEPGSNSQPEPEPKLESSLESGPDIDEEKILRQVETETQVSALMELVIEIKQTRKAEFER